MALVTQAEVQQWLSVTKTPVPSTIPAELLASAKIKMQTTLSVRYDTSVWVDESSTPAFIRQLIGMEIAARLWLATYPAQAGEADSYGRWLLDRVTYMLDGLVSGTYELPATQPTTTPEDKQPIFFPTDAATELYEQEGDVEGAAARHFTMGQVF